MNIFKRKIYLSPKQLSGNSFVEKFTKSLETDQNAISNFSWKKIFFSGIVIFHWPDEFFSAHAFPNSLKVNFKLMLLRVSKFIFGTKVLWVVHNTKPHSSQGHSNSNAEKFIELVDGLIFLSQSSKEILFKEYVISEDMQTLCTVHGNYERPEPSYKRNSRTSPGVVLCAFGQIQKYKNFDTLAEVFSSLEGPSNRLLIAGRATDRSISDPIINASLIDKRISALIKDSLLSEQELHNVIDDSDGVVLPYKNILNSGSAILALSRNKFVLAPNIGSLKELQGNVGERWLELYEGELTADVLSKFIKRVGLESRDEICDLSRYSWKNISDDLNKFMLEIDRR